MTKFSAYCLSSMVIFTPAAQGCTIDRNAIPSDRAKRDASVSEKVSFEMDGASESRDSAPAVSHRDGETREAGQSVDTGIDATKETERPDAASDKRDSGGPVAHKDSAVEPPTTTDLPPTTAARPYGDWTYYEVSGAVCRDGSPAGYYLRKGSSKNLLIFLNGGGVCYDDLFCSSNPANVDESLPGETLMDATIETFQGRINPVRQVPPDEGILNKDSRNPVADWTMIYVPYCTGDVHGGTEHDAKVITSNALPPQQFVGYTNIGLFYQSFGPEYLNSEKVLLAGVSAGGFGAVLNFERTQQFFSNSRVFIISDSGIPFRDKYQAPCLQKLWRELWGLDDIIPKGCTDCFKPNGGGLAELSNYYIRERKGKNRILGGFISSKQDEVMKLFYSAGLNNCTINTSMEAAASLRGMSSYPADQYPQGLQDFIENVVGKENGGSYIVEGTNHQHLFRPRFYETNGVDMTLAEWVGEIISGNATHVGTLE